jgi:hypothetical protein
MMIDSGTSYILMPESDRLGFVNAISTELGITCWLQTLIYVCMCTEKESTYDKFPDLEFVVDNKSYKLPRNSYMIYE